MEIELVLHTSYGGFYFDDEMALWLQENKGWVLLPKNEEYWNKEYNITTLVKIGHDMHVHPHMRNEIELRSHPDLIECVKALKKKHKNDKLPENRAYIHQLDIQLHEINIEIEDYYDGKERVNIY